MGTPTQLLEKLVQQRVELRLKDQRSVSGRLLGLDEHMNLVLDEAEERSADRTRRLGRLVVRGSNVITMNIAGPATKGPG